eukprot:scaffold35346_cov69-Phaeocystis_antarctica.AAC.2
MHAPCICMLSAPRLRRVALSLIELWPIAAHRVAARRVAARQLERRHPDLRRAPLAAGDGEVGVEDGESVEGATRGVREHGRRAWCGGGGGGGDLERPPHRRRVERGEAQLAVDGAVLVGQQQQRARGRVRVDLVSVAKGAPPHEARRYTCGRVSLLHVAHLARLLALRGDEQQRTVARRPAAHREERILLLVDQHVLLLRAAHRMPPHRGGPVRAVVPHVEECGLVEPRQRSRRALERLQRAATAAAAAIAAAIVVVVLQALQADLVCLIARAVDRIC